MLIEVLRPVFPLAIMMLLALVFMSYLLMQFSAWWFLVLCLSYIKSREIKEEHQASVFHEFGKLLI